MNLSVSVEKSKTVIYYQYWSKNKNIENSIKSKCIWKDINSVWYDNKYLIDNKYWKFDPETSVSILINCQKCIYL